jgi:ribonucleoside-diphosphate reductase alpha chain
MSNEITAKEHIGVLCTAQMHVDSACSKTVNVPANFSFDEFKELYVMAFEGGAKGCTTYRPAGNYDEPIKAAEAEKAADEAEQREQPEACGWDPVTGARTGSCAEN